MKIAHKGFRRIAGFIALSSLIAFFVFHDGFFSRGSMISNDTRTYVNTPGLAAGFSLSNFESEIRTPGLSLFLAAATLGKLPRLNAVIRVRCDESIFEKGPPCDQIIAPEPDDIAVRKPPVVFFYSRATARQFQQVITSAKILLIASFAALYFAMTMWLDPILAAAVGAALWRLSVPTAPSELEVVMTECLFPALLFLYAAAAMASLSFRSIIWPLLASALVFFIFIVKPSLIYIVAIQIVLLAWLGWQRTLWAAIVAGVPLLLGFGWFLLFSPTNYLSETNSLSEALRVAILSDETTVACLPDADSKVIIRAYMYSAYFSPRMPPLDTIHNDVDRYFALGQANAYRLELPLHPIYSDPSIKPYLTKEGLLSSNKIRGAMHEAMACNWRRDLKFAALISQMVLGLLPPSTPSISQRFFFAPYFFWLSIATLFAALFLTILQGDIRRTAIIIGLAAIHVFYVVVVAFKQGGESRYIMVTEPAFALAFLFAAAFLLERTLRFAVYRSYLSACVILTLGPSRERACDD
jgi:hypothetical protein